jgi:hypothetical protein
MRGRIAFATSHMDLEYPCQSDKESCSLKARTNQIKAGNGNSPYRNVILRKVRY